MMIRRFLVCLVLCLAVPLTAQVDRASLTATVLDQSGAPIPGVTVTLTRPDTGFTSVLVTDSSGSGRFSTLAPGTYDVEFALEGFASITRNQMVLRVGENARVGIEMRAAASEAITVTGSSPLVDIHKTDSSTNITPEQIDSLPVADRDFQRLAFITPGVQRERGAFRFVGGGPVIGAGGNASQATILVNGMDLTDQALGLARTRFSQDAIREFRVITNRFDSEIGGSAGGALSIVTKSGTNEMHGNVFGFFRDDSLRSKSTFEQEKNDYTRSQLGFTLGGPFVRDKLFYFTSVERIDEDNIALFRPGGAFASTARDIEHPFTQTLLFGAADVIFNSQQTGGARVVYEDYDEENFRVGGVVDVSAGQKLERTNWNASFEHNWAISANASNAARFQYGGRKYFEPTNSDAVGEWFSGGNTLQTGSNILGDLLGDGTTWEIRDTLHLHRTVGRSTHHIKTGFSFQHVDERSRIDVYEDGLFVYLTDTRALPLVYAYGVGSSDVRADTDIYGLFIEDSWRPTTKLVLNLGLRYDLDTNGNNPDFEHPLVPNGRDRDDDNIQPRFSFSYDLRGDGTSVVRGGAGLFTGRFLLVPVFSELQQNGVTGRVLFTRLNGALFGFPSLALDPNNPTTTGIVSKPAIGLMSPTLEAPESTQASLGYTMRLGSSRMFIDGEAIYVEGDNEIIIRDINFDPTGPVRRPNTNFDQINMYTNEGRSEYKAFVLSLNGNLRQRDLITASVTFADKKNISDDFSPEFPFGYPSDPSNIEAEYGPARGAEDYRIVVSGVFHLPYGLTAAPIFEYGSGQPWTHRLGYDANGDGKNSDRPAGVGRNTMDGPSFQSVSLRLSRGFAVPGFGVLEAIVEGFNILDEENFDVNSVNAAEFLAGPTAANPAGVRNPNFGTYRATLPPREIQLGLRMVF
ncbi:MAG TPA: TonB-dependent receptor [Rhodothermales bacterium]|nr:TonB-dependent receptor [Rhodothermales bacterium]